MNDSGIIGECLWPSRIIFDSVWIICFSYNHLFILVPSDTIFLFQIVLLVAGIGWGDIISRKIIYWGMLTGDILLLAVQASFVHSMSKWNAVNIAIVTVASAFALFRIITLILNPRWWEWAPEPIIWLK